MAHFSTGLTKGQTFLRYTMDKRLWRARSVDPRMDRIRIRVILYLYKIRFVSADLLKAQLVNNELIAIVCLLLNLIFFFG